MSYTKHYLDQEMENGNDLLHVPDDTDIDYKARRHDYANARCAHEHCETTPEGGVVCLSCGDYTSPEDILNSFKEMFDDDERGKEDEDAKN